MGNEEKLLNICADVMDLDVNTLTLETTRDELDEFDSLSIIQIIAEMEETFQCSIDESYLENVIIENIGDFLRLLQKEN